MKPIGLIALLSGCATVFDLDEVHFDPTIAVEACYGLYGQGRTGMIEICLDACQRSSTHRTVR